MQAEVRFSRWLWFILLAGLVLRLAFSLSQPTFAWFSAARGGDTGWYLANGYGFFSGQAHGWVDNIPFYNTKTPTPPLYILFSGIVLQFVSKEESVALMRILQCAAGIATIYLACRITGQITGEPKAPMIVAFVGAFHPAFVVEPAMIATETLYIFFLALGFWIYTEYFVNAYLGERRSSISPRAGIALAALAFALATLTRAVAILVPLVLVIHTLYLGRRRFVRKWRSYSLLLILVYAALVSTWTIHNLVLWDRFVLVSDQLLPAIWRGMEANDGSPAENDALLLEDTAASENEGCQVDCKYQHPASLYIERIAGLVRNDLPGLLVLRINDLAYSIIQPHGTAAFGDVGIRVAISEWLQTNRSLEGLYAVLQIEGFALKLLVWLLHLGGIGLGLLGMIITRARLPLTMPLIGLVIYTVLAHMVLLALPRYMFPLEIVWLIFGGAALAAILEGNSSGSGYSAASQRSA